MHNISNSKLQLEKLDGLEIQQLSFNNELFQQVRQIWKDNHIPDCHQKYFYNILKTHESQAVTLMRQEMESFQNNHSVVKTLHQLTLSREHCLKEIQKTRNIGQMDYVRLISKLIYDLRKLTYNLIEFHRKWRNALSSKYQYNYTWIINRRDYLLKIRDDSNLIQITYPKMLSYFNLKEKDIFYLSVIEQAHTENVEYYDFLAQHQIKKSSVQRMMDLQRYFQELTDESHLVESNQMMETMSFRPNTSKLLHSQRAKVDIPAVTQLDDYPRTMLYVNEDLEFTIHHYPERDIEKVITYWQSKNIIELNESFKCPIAHLKDVILFWQEATIIQINQSALLVCSIDQDSNFRKWIIHSIYVIQEQQQQPWQQQLNHIVQNLIKMLIQKGDNFGSLLISCSNDKPIKTQLHNLKFSFLKNHSYNQLNVSFYEQKIPQGQVNAKDRRFFTPLTLRMVRVFATQTQSQLITDEELLVAQFGANLGKNNIIHFENNITALQPILSKSKLYGQEYVLIHKLQDIKNRFSVEFNSPIDGPVYFQNFAIKLNFQYFSSEIHRNTNAPYIRLISHPPFNEQEGSILELTSSDANMKQRKIYLVSTINPNIKIYIYEVQQNEITKSNIQQNINQIFERFDKKQEGLQNIWLPFFKATGNQLTLPNSIVNGFFQNNTEISFCYHRIPGFHSISNVHDLDKVIQPPFLIGFVQNDIEQINKPLFSMLVEKDCIIRSPERILQGNLQGQQPLPLLLQPRDIDGKINELLKITVLEVQKSFNSDPYNLSYKLKFGLEAALLNLYNGYALIYVDENHFHEKKWIIESIMTNNLDNLQGMLMKLSDYIFNADIYASEIQISQNHYSDQGELVANKQVVDSIKRAKFKWRLVDNDAKSQQRKTVYYLKRPVQDFPPKKENQISIQFQNYYALQQSEQRIKTENKLEYFKIKDHYQLFEDCFQFHLESDFQDENPFLRNKFQQYQGSLANSDFKVLLNQNELKSQLQFDVKLPNFDPHLQMVNVLQMNTQLRLKRQRQVMIGHQKYIEIPNLMGTQQIYQADLYQKNLRVFFVPTSDSLSYFYFIELHNQQMANQVKQDYLNITTMISQSFPFKYNHSCKSLLIQQFEKKSQMTKDSNFLFIEFALSSQYTIEPQVVLEEKSDDQQWVVQLPIVCGVLQTNVRNQYERPLIAWIIEN
ncbi:unnamed protein product (macronuclear) [Paramecium tetraurelia]|uniref:Mediator of RNA polymerase II transcription subunit 14 n=1 Tax=Paramecium tetraurelia TaxID=5888 RepID=A0DMI7_PARTE|nr:uncharacterized protein GSPATT00018472001 [Paramecium tetraurelia]CAK84254.1 unnamed protein product [Paramecium tetraurelia]|eukprot:XP_001451651.1 hypothetical protein (macronuclear) [Paramecium tetraurelia strain d4-2]